MPYIFRSIIATGLGIGFIQFANNLESEYFLLDKPTLLWFKILVYFLSGAIIILGNCWIVFLSKSALSKSSKNNSIKLKENK